MLDLVGNPEDRVSCIAAHLSIYDAFLELSYEPVHEKTNHAQKWSINLPGYRIIIPIGRVLKI